ncbi:NAD(P)/FAD-dependent oxidoreductase [Inquilinus limosus]|uniref:NADH:ubiquinone reductase (non-electrogenic) n=1 Tax=Inquilinus limosus TaxID=171674 RepID=A0A211ZHJ3_9PROT|nr:NAD(P)/FAD-dependent oxidoreductase [Inquilinus limosus]OWJ64654.1 FAD-dependent oxidoreductase [Inquilinus limosus]
MTEARHRVVVIGAGFGGLQAVLRLKGAPVDITLIDRRNHHLFQPLLYQVATASLAPSEIAWPVRNLVAGRPEVRTILGEVTGIDKAARQVQLHGEAPVPYDTLLVATGARHAYFGHDDWEPFAPGLKDIDDATAIRRRILLAFERAEVETDPAVRRALLTFVIVGAGPTGVEVAGTIAELAHHTMARDFRALDPKEARILLVEAGPRVLSAFPEDLSAYAKSALERLGAEILTGHAVTECDADGVKLGAERVPAKTVIWAAGVQASPAAVWLGAEADRAGRVMIAPDLTLPGHPEIFVVGDTARLDAWNGQPLPGIAPAAKQQGQHVADTIRARLEGKAEPRPFRYKHAGSLATIGKRAAVIDFGWIKLRGWLAWWIWGFAHIYFLIGLRNRLTVALSWLWIYTTGQRSARLITGREQEEE